MQRGREVREGDVIPFGVQFAMGLVRVDSSQCGMAFMTAEPIWAPFIAVLSGAVTLPAASCWS
jgi:hypothetical protein